MLDLRSNIVLRECKKPSNNKHIALLGVELMRICIAGALRFQAWKTHGNAIAAIEGAEVVLSLVQKNLMAIKAFR